MRQMITFMVMEGGFSLVEVRKLYLDEMFDFYKYTFFNLEQKGLVKKGTFDRLDGMSKVENTVNQLRSQLFNVTKKKK